MSPEEREIVDAASPRVKAILLGTHVPPMTMAELAASEGPARTRATRSDKGTKKGPKVEAAAPQGAPYLTKEQAARLSGLVEEREQAVVALAKAEYEIANCTRNVKNADAAYESFIDSLTK